MAHIEVTGNAEVLDVHLRVRAVRIIAFLHGHQYGVVSHNGLIFTYGVVF